MGLTIHWDLQFKGTAEQALQKLKTIHSIAQDLPFEKISDIWELNYNTDYNDDSENKKIANDLASNYRWAKIQYSPPHECNNKYNNSENDTKFKGWVFMAYAGEGCEPSNIGLVSLDEKHWYGHAFTKTQYAVQFVRDHLLVVSLLDVCKKIGILKEVMDEGSYWETRNITVLGEEINKSTTFIKQIGSILNKIKDPGVTVESEITKSENYVVTKKKPRKRF